MVVTASEDAGRLESGLALAQKVDRPLDSELRILIFTATYFVLDGVTLTIRRLEAHLRARGATVKILSTVPDTIDPELTKNIIIVPGIKIPFNHMGDYSFGVGLDENTIQKIEEYKPNCVHFTVPDFVALEGVRYCQRNNIAYMGTWHSNYADYLKYYYIEWILGYLTRKYLKSFFEQVPTVYVPTKYVSSTCLFFLLSAKYFISLTFYLFYIFLLFTSLKLISIYVSYYLLNCVNLTFSLIKVD